MKWKILGIAVLLSSLTSCALIRVSSDYDRAVDFQRYETFAFYKSGMDALKVSDLNKRRIMHDIKAHLTAKGMRLAEKPDVYVNVLFKSKDQVDILSTGYPYGWGWWGYPWGFGWRQLQSYSYELGTIYIDLIDAKTGKLVWEGKSAQKVSSDLSEAAAYFKRAVDAILSQYPPKGKSL